MKSLLLGLLASLALATTALAAPANDPLVAPIHQFTGWSWAATVPQPANTQ